MIYWSVQQNNKIRKSEISIVLCKRLFLFHSRRVTACAYICPSPWLLGLCSRAASTWRPPSRSSPLPPCQRLDLSDHTKAHSGRGHAAGLLHVAVVIHVVFGSEGFGSVSALLLLQTQRQEVVDVVGRRSTRHCRLLRGAGSLLRECRLLRGAGIIPRNCGQRPRDLSSLDATYRGQGRRVWSRLLSGRNSIKASKWLALKLIKIFE